MMTDELLDRVCTVLAVAMERYARQGEVMDAPHGYLLAYAEPVAAEVLCYAMDVLQREANARFNLGMTAHGMAILKAASALRSEVE